MTKDQVIEQMREALETIISYNRDHARDQYGDADKHQTESAEYWHKLYIDKCRQMNDAVAILGAEIETLELAALGDATLEVYEPDIIAQYDEAYAATHGSQRQWYSVGAWLYEGDAIAVISGATKKE